MGLAALASWALAGTTQPFERHVLAPAHRLENLLPGGPFRYDCFAANEGETWYDDYIKYLLQSAAKSQCSQVPLLATPLPHMHPVRAALHLLALTSIINAAVPWR